MIASSGTREGESSSGVTPFEDDFDDKCVRVSIWAQCWSPQAQMLDVGKRIGHVLLSSSFIDH